MSRAAASLCALLFALLAPRAALAFGRETTSSVRGEVDADSASERAEGVYGRFDGDLDLGLGLGAQYDAGNEQASVAARVSAHYFSLAGLYADYSDGLGADDGLARSVGFGVDLRPLFIPRWALDMQRGPALLDLTLDSISLALGAYFAQPARESFGDELGFAASLGFGVPLALYASGPWLELRGGLLVPDDGETRGSVVALLSWHFLAITPLSPESERVR